MYLVLDNCGTRAPTKAVTPIEYLSYLQMQFINWPVVNPSAMYGTVITASAYFWFRPPSAGLTEGFLS